MQLFVKSCVLYLWKEHTSLIWSSSSPFCQKFVHVLIYPLGWVGQLPNWPSIKNAHVFRVSRTVAHSSHLISLSCAKPAPSRLSSLLSALPSLCCYKPLLACKSFFSFVIRWKSSSSSSSFFVFFNRHSSVFFYYYFIYLIWSEKYILKVNFWLTKHQATSICYQKPPGTNTDLNFFFFTYKKKIQILHALFLLKIYLFSCWVLKKICGYMLCNFFKIGRASCRERV